MSQNISYSGNFSDIYTNSTIMTKISTNTSTNYTNDTTADQSSDTIGVPCTMNVDCQKSSWCCSGGKCVPGSTCYQGSKLINDFCNMNYECLSRCCRKNACSNFIYCAETCTQNSDCPFQCCSFGYCSASNVCAGRKADGDTCNQDSECQSNSCVIYEGSNGSQIEANSTSGLSGICRTKSYEQFDYWTIISVLIVIFAIIVLSIGCYCLFRQCHLD